mmetsp:Transcript_5242/g.17536  ORF Transcript_5242/g.17536 Transcript_5242/m.17536 type:complete len:262 (+) Transcript_5242:358-1143(+)
MRRSDSVALPILDISFCFCLLSFSALRSAASSRSPVADGERARASEAASRRVAERSDGTREPDRTPRLPPLPPPPTAPSTSIASASRRLADRPRSSPPAGEAGARALALERALASAAASVSMPMPDRCCCSPPSDFERARTLRGIVGWLAAFSRRAVALITPFFLRIALASLATCACASAAPSSIGAASAASAASAARSSSSRSSSSSLASMSGSTKSAMFLPSMISGIMSSAHSGRLSSHCRCSGSEYTPAPPPASSRSR